MCSQSCTEVMKKVIAFKIICKITYTNQLYLKTGDQGFGYHAKFI